MTTPTATLVGFKNRRRASRTRSLKAWYRNGSLMAGIVIVGLLVVVAVAAPVIAPYDPVKQHLEAALESPSSAHWLGTDKYGRDVLSRLIWGARVDLRVGFLAVLIPFVVGSVVGAIAGYVGGIVDTILMRIVDVFFAFPFYVMVIVLVFVLGAGEASIYLAIAAVSWVSYAKIVRGEVLVAKQQDYVVAARLGGMSHVRLLVRHIAPNVMTQAIIYAMSDIVMDIMAIVTLGYLGLGIEPPTAEWGSMIVDGQEFITTQWQQTTIPGLVVVVTSLGLSWLGDGISDLLSPDRRR
ncbi:MULTISPECIES: ABC transporter permease [unclassified Curtobacterium]|uniref:ABC transporter permease n=1 Tax=unclassified Curtobacterium TaxID=257496 RepID=UPI000DAAAAC2|nr:MULTISPECIES: ABC transporter permease [unclassified Curtobacterium]PZE24162.1 ABC transporter permease [Curtobacterium sp. MCBD17_028]PZE71557.1 ABC transporter permease [Curtobacterium sp. MCBD17_019]PZF55475.1 ABC transporter permease [Curtobacterium sp. MCBD17_034]PZF58139.1 ABC transporter permease [Curtobacterium sp. MCBD17_013]PZM34755.1 ABC transporter permease [Curtobacterium sp. MCBD17_031]